MILLITGILLISLGALIPNKTIMWTMIGSGIVLCFSYVLLEQKPSFYWKTGIDGACNLETRTKERSVYCVNEEGAEVPEDLCPGRKPKEELECE